MNIKEWKNAISSNVRDVPQKHTPGPWYWHLDLALNELKLRSETSNVVMDFYRMGYEYGRARFRGAFAMAESGDLCTYDDGDKLIPVDHPDAHLIAAAPELLEALQDLLAIADDSEGVAGYHANSNLAFWEGLSVVENARRAVAKATGRL